MPISYLFYDLEVYVPVAQSKFQAQTLIYPKDWVSIIPCLNYCSLKQNLNLCNFHFSVISQIHVSVNTCIYKIAEVWHMKYFEGNS